MHAPKSARGLQLTQRLRNRIVGDGIHHSDFEGSGGGDFFRGDEKLERSALPDQARQALRTSPSGHEAESGAAMSKDGMGRGDPAVTGEREIETSAHAVAIDGGDDRGGKLAIAFMSVCPMAENWQASEPVSAAISFRSAPTEKKWRLPAMISGRSCFCSSSLSSAKAAVSASTQARVRRLVPSGEVRRKMRAEPSDFIRKKSEDTGT